MSTYMGFTDSYQTEAGFPFQRIPLHPLKGGGLFTRPRIELLQDVYYRNPDFDEIVCLAGIYDGFSIPTPIWFLSGGYFSPIMPVIESTIPHDVACREKLMTAEKRADLFASAYDDAVVQFYNCVNPDNRRGRLIRGAFIGSKYCGTC